jgi:hypothetical protein
VAGARTNTTTPIAPRTAIAPVATKAAKNEPVAWTMKPVASGATMPPQLAMKWTKPETPPTRSCSMVSRMMAQ